MYEYQLCYTGSILFLDPNPYLKGKPGGLDPDVFTKPETGPVSNHSYSASLKTVIVCSPSSLLTDGKL